MMTFTALANLTTSDLLVAFLIPTVLVGLALVAIKTIDRLCDEPAGRGGLNPLNPRLWR